MSKQDFDKIGKIIADTGNIRIEKFDIVFLIDATSSMSPYIEAAKCTAEDISKILRQKFPETNFQYGYVFYRDPIDSKGDFHEIINLTDNVNSLPEKIGKIKAIGGADIPEDWAGAYKKVNEEIKWRNGNKVIFHLADAGAHGKLFTPYDKYPDEEQKLIKELEICCEKKVKIFGFVIEEDSRNSFEKCKDIYKNKGGFYEIYNFEKPEGAFQKHSIFGSHKYYEEAKTFEEDYKYSDKNDGLFSNKESESLFGLVKHNSFLKNTDNNNINDHTNLFGNNKKINSLFGNNNYKDDLYSNIEESSNNKRCLFGNIKENNNNTNSLFREKKENNHYACNLFGCDKENNNNNINSLFGSNNNNSESLFGSKIENNKKPACLFECNIEKENNNAVSLFGCNIDNNNNSCKLFGNVKKYNEEMNYQSKLNSSFLNLVINSIQNINKN